MIASIDFKQRQVYQCQMHLKEAREHFGSEYKIAKILQLHQSTLTRWGKKKIPMYWAWQLHVISGRKLIFNPDDYTRQ